MLPSRLIACRSCVRSRLACRGEIPNSGMQMRESRNVWFTECKNVGVYNWTRVICCEFYWTTRPVRSLRYCLSSCLIHSRRTNFSKRYHYSVIYTSVSQPPCPGINYTRPREVLLEFIILVFWAIFMNKCFIVEIFWGEKYSWMCRKTQTQMKTWGNYNMLQDFMSPMIDN